jgi:hypothetical protein
MIVDVAFGGDQGQHMYVLDSFSGVTVFRLDFIGADSISLNLDKEFG